MGESSSICSCIQIYKALAPPAPPPPASVSRRDGRSWASILRGILRGATLPRSRTVRSPVRARRCGCGGLGGPPSRWLHLPSEAQAQKPPPAPRGPADGLPCPCAARGAADGLPHVLPCPPLSHRCALVPALPAHGGRGGGGCAAPGGDGDHPVPDPGPVPNTLDPEQQPLAAPVPATQHPLQHPTAPDPALQHPAPHCSRSRGGGRSPCVPSARAAAVSTAEMEPKTSTRLARPVTCPLPPPRGTCPWEGVGPVMP